MGARLDSLDRGQALVEYALSLVVFMLLVMGILDFGRGILFYNMLSNAARDGARVGVVAAATSDEICAAAFSSTVLPNAPSSTTCGTSGALTVNVPQRGIAGDPTTPVRVTMVYQFALVTPLIVAITGSPIALSASSTMYVEG